MEIPKYETAQTINFRLYTFFGYWKKGSKNKFVEFSYNLYSAFVIMSTTLYTILQLIDLKDSWSSIEELSANLSATSTSIFSISKVYSFRLRVKRVESIRRKIREFLNVPGIGIGEEDREIFERQSAHYMRTCKVFYSLVWPTIFTWWIVPATNGTLPVRQWIPFEFEKFGLVYYGVYVYQCILLGYFAAIVAFMDLIFCLFVFALCAHLDVLEKDVRKYGNEVSEAAGDPGRLKESRKKLGLIVRHHQEILKTTQEVDDLFRSTNLIHFLGIAVLISVTEYDLILKTATLNTVFFRQLGNLGSAFVDLFLYCYYGTLLEEKSRNIAFAAYDTNWIDLTTSDRKMLSFIMVRSSRHARITAGKMFALNVGTYLQVLRTSYNVLAVLRQTKT